MSYAKVRHVSKHGEFIDAYFAKQRYWNYGSEVSLTWQDAVPEARKTLGSGIESCEVWIDRFNSVGWPLSGRPVVTFPDTEHHRTLGDTKLYCLVTELALLQECEVAGSQILHLLIIKSAAPTNVPRCDCTHRLPAIINTWIQTFLKSSSCATRLIRFVTSLATAKSKPITLVSDS